MDNNNKILFSSSVILILSISILHLIVKSLYNNINFSVSHYIAISTVLISVFLVFYDKMKAVYFVSCILILSFLNLFSFTYTTDTYSFFLTIGNSGVKTISVQFFPLFLFFLHVYLNQKYFNILIFRKRDNEDKHIYRTNYFKRKFVIKSKEELELIIKNKNQYTKEAVEAARELLKEM